MHLKWLSYHHVVSLASFQKWVKSSRYQQKCFQLSDKNLQRQGKQEGKHEQGLQMNKTTPDKAQQRGENWLCSIRITNPHLTHEATVHFFMLPELIQKREILPRQPIYHSLQCQTPTYSSACTWPSTWASQGPQPQWGLLARTSLNPSLEVSLEYLTACIAQGHQEDWPSRHTHLGLSLTHFAFPPVSHDILTDLWLQDVGKSLRKGHVQSDYEQQAQDLWAARQMCAREQ